jgi:hypothetical protein
VRRRAPASGGKRDRYPCHPAPGKISGLAHRGLCSPLDRKACRMPPSAKPVNGEPAAPTHRAGTSFSGRSARGWSGERMAFSCWTPRERSDVRPRHSCNVRLPPGAAVLRVFCVIVPWCAGRSAPPTTLAYVPSWGSTRVAEAACHQEQQSEDAYSTAGDVGLTERAARRSSRSRSSRRRWLRRPLRRGPRASRLDSGRPCSRSKALALSGVDIAESASRRMPTMRLDCELHGLEIG